MAELQRDCLIYCGHPIYDEYSSWWWTEESIWSSLEFRDGWSWLYRNQITAMIWKNFRKVGRSSLHALKTKHKRRGGIPMRERWLEEGKGIFSFFLNWKSLLMSFSSWAPTSHYPSTKSFCKPGVWQEKQLTGEEESNWCSENQTLAGSLLSQKTSQGCCVWDVFFVVARDFSFSLCQSTVWKASTMT